jgi:hypothetical protein
MKSIIHDWLCSQHKKVIHKWISSPVDFGFYSPMSDWSAFKAFNLYSVDIKKSIRLNPRILFK